MDFTGLLEPQKDHALTLLNSIYLNGVAADMSDTGCGKMYIGSWIAKQLNCPTVVVCPCSVISTWDEVLKSFGVKQYIIINYEKLMRGHTPYVTYKKQTNKKHPITGQPLEFFKYQLIDVHFQDNSFIILDEAHKCGAPSSLNAGFMIGIKNKGYKVLTSSATQATDVLNMKAFGYLTNLHSLSNYRSWCIKNGAEESEYDHDKLVFNKSQAEIKMRDCHNNLFNYQKIASRLTREMMASVFPENHIIPQSYDFGKNNSKIISVYDQMQDEIAMLDERTENYSGHIFAIILKARMQVELLKMPFFIDTIHDILDENNSVAVFLNFNDSIDFLYQNLRQYGVSLIIGGQKDRDNQKALFQSNKNKIIICNTKSGGESISLHDIEGGHPRQSLIAPTWSARDLLQCLGRICRTNGKSKCLQRIIYADNTIENRICERLTYKINNLNNLNDGDLAEVSFI